MVVHYQLLPGRNSRVQEPSHPIENKYACKAENGGTTIYSRYRWNHPLDILWIGLDAVMRGVTEMEKNMGGARQAVKDD
jgi:hypothetical protein